MTAYDDETLMRRIDGELSPQAGDRIDADALQDPALAARLAQMRGLRTLARDAFTVTTDPRDAALSRLITSTGRTTPTWARLSRAFTEAFAPRRAALWAGIGLAAFVAGVVVGPLINPKETFNFSPGGAISDPALIRVLDDRLASDGPDARGRAVDLTYRDADGRWCRTFRAGQAGVAGLACRDRDEWAIQVLAPLGVASADIRTAAADTPGAILSAVDAGLAGETLDAVDEKRARDAGWR